MESYKDGEIESKISSEFEESNHFSENQDQKSTEWEIWSHRILNRIFYHFKIQDINNNYNRPSNEYQDNSLKDDR